MATSDKLQRILDTKYDIRNAISEKGVDIDEKTLFSEYADKIREIAGEMSNGEGYPVIFNAAMNWSISVNGELVTEDDCIKYRPLPDYPAFYVYIYFSKNPTEYVSFADNKYMRQVYTVDTNFIKEITFENCTNLNFISHSVMTANGYLTNLNNTFRNCSRLEFINLSGTEYNNCDMFNYTFEGCTSLRDIYLADWDYDHVHMLLEQSLLPSSTGDKYIHTTIDDKDQLEELNRIANGWNVLGRVVNEPVVSPDQPSYNHPDFFDWRTDGNTNYEYLFYNCDKTDFDFIKDWDTSSVTDMSYTFGYCDMTSLDVSNWNTKKVYRMYGTFANCKSLTSLDISKWDTINVGYLSNMFNHCEALTSLDINGWNTSNVTNMESVFAYCKSLTSLDISNWDLSKTTTMSAMFTNCTNLVDLYPPQNISNTTSFKGSDKLSHDSLMRVINNLATISFTRTLTLGTTNLAKLTDDEKLIATQKGWALA